MKISGIYKIKNRVDGKVYIGSSISVSRRIACHKSKLTSGKHENRVLQSAWDKYGRESFDFEMIEAVPLNSELIEREQFWMDSENAVKDGYNICPTALSSLGLRGFNLGKPCSEDKRRAISAALIGRKNGPPCPETRRNISLALKGRKLSEAQKAQMSARQTGKKLRPEHAANIGKAHLHRKPTGCSSNHLGVTYCKQTNRWRVILRLSGKRRCFGRYETEDMAASVATHNLVSPALVTS